ncbi:hypothetical protein ACQ86N_22220 [Puia sp. P3]|uniref:hypothetical protein n=1 Tax=Puia sp. P3 TaxID=3423952 RepID=UPI003D672584
MGVIKKIQYNCREATYLIEKRQHVRLSIKERIHLLIHLSGCSVCRLFQQQSRMINRAVKGLFKDRAEEEKRLDDGIKKEMQDRINERLTRR